jgi:hypothetical protein
MSGHIFSVGDEVRLTGTLSATRAEAFLELISLSERGRVPKAWEVTRLLPADEAGFQYHVRCLHDGSERLAHERDLAPATAAARPGA